MDRSLAPGSDEEYLEEEEDEEEYAKTEGDEDDWDNVPAIKGPLPQRLEEESEVSAKQESLEHVNESPTDEDRSGNSSKSESV